MKKRYSKNELIEALRALGLQRGDIVFSHSNIGFLGFPEQGTTAEIACETVKAAFLEVLGPSGTLVVPTFTYSFSNQQVFDSENTPSTCGIFTNYIRLQPEAYRSQDPHVSVAAIGKEAKQLTENVSSNAYDEDSFFARFYQAKGKICNINFDAGSTFVHYVERVLKVPYRFDKTFSGKMIQKGVPVLKKATIFVAYRVQGTAANFEPFHQLAVEKELFKSVRVGRGSVGVISAADTFQVIQETLPSRPWLLTDAENKSIVPTLPKRLTSR